MTKARPKTGEARRWRQPLKIDRLPSDVHEQIQKLKAAGHTWAEIEEMSPAFVSWDKLDKEVVKLFPGHRLPHTNLHRWYDLRVQQVREETLRRAESSRQVAAAFAGRSFKELPDAVRNLLGDMVFTFTEKSGAEPEEKLFKAATELGWLLQRFRANDIREKKVAIDKRKIELAERELELKKKAVEKVTDEAAAKIGKGKDVTLDDINKIRERTFGLPPIASQRGPAGAGQRHG